MMMLSIVAMAQSIIVVDKDGNRVPYDPAKVTSVEFQTTPPGFTVNHDKGFDLYLFDQVMSLRGNPNYVFVDPETVKVDGEGEDLAVQVKANVEFDVTTSDAWITFEPDGKDGLQYVKVAMNPTIEERSGSVTLTSKDGTLVTTLKVEQAGKEDGRYIDIDWEKATLDSYDTETGETKITFAEEVPVMGKYDAFVQPTVGGDFTIRVINEVTKIEGKTVTLNTEIGDLGNIFKDTEFTLAFGEQEAAARTRGAGGNVIQPMKVELFDGKKYVEVYNANAPKTRGDGDGSSADAKIKLDYSGEDIVLFNDGNAVVNINEVKYNVGLSALMYMKFTKKKWYEVWKGEVSDVKVQIQGKRDYEVKATQEIASADERDTWKESVTYVDYFNPQPAIAYTEMVFTFKKDNKVVRAAASMQLFTADFGYKGVGYGTAKTHVSNSTDFAVSEDQIITYDNPNNDIDDTNLSFRYEERTEGFFDYRLEGEFKIRMFGTEVYSADFSPGQNTVRFCRESADEEGYGKLGNYAYIDIQKIFLGTDCGEFAGNKVDKRLHDKNLIPGYLELNGKLADQEENIVPGVNTISFHAYHEDHQGHRFDSKRALIQVKVVSASRNEEYELVTDDQGNVDFDLIYTEYDSGGYVEATIYNPYKDEYKDAPSDMTRVFTFHPVDYRVTCDTFTPIIPADEESVPITFQLEKFKEGKWVPAYGETLYFYAEKGGSVSPWTERTNGSGKGTTTFTQESPDIDNGAVEATYSIKEPVYKDPDHVFKGGTTCIILKEKRPSMEKSKPKIRVWDSGEGGNKPKVIDDKGDGEIVFVVEERIEGEDADKPIAGVKVEFETDNQDDNLEGFSWATTDKDGKAPAKFKVKDFAKFKGVKIKAKATVKYSDGEKEVETTVQVKSDGTLDDGSGSGGGDPCGGGISDSDLKKAYELEQNTYMIDGKVTKLDGPEDMIEWSVNEDIEGNRFNAVNWFKEDPDYYTTGWGTIYGFLDDMFGEEIYVSEGSGLSISFGAFIDPSAGYNETNVVDFNSGNTQKAVFRLCKDADGNIYAIAFVRSKDGKEGAFKVKAKPAPANSRPQVR